AERTHSAAPNEPIPPRRTNPFRRAERTHSAAPNEPIPPRRTNPFRRAERTHFRRRTLHETQPNARSPACVAHASARGRHEQSHSVDRVTWASRTTWVGPEFRGAPDLHRKWSRAGSSLWV